MSSWGIITVKAQIACVKCVLHWELSVICPVVVFSFSFSFESILFLISPVSWGSYVYRLNAKHNMWHIQHTTNNNCLNKWIIDLSCRKSPPVIRVGDKLERYKNKNKDLKAIVVIHMRCFENLSQELEQRMKYRKHLHNSQFKGPDGVPDYESPRSRHHISHF